MKTSGNTNVGLMIACVIAFTFTTSAQQAGWRWQNPYLHGNNLNSIIMNGVDGWAVGDMGVVMRTENSGLDWEIVDLKTTRNLNCIYLEAISGRGWIVGQHGSVFYTSDGGEHWKKQNSQTSKDLKSITATGGNCPWILGENVILKSPDNGETWELKNCPFEDLLDIDMIDCDEVWLCGHGGHIYSTKDDGLTWQAHTTPTTFNLRSIDVDPNSDFRACGNQSVIIRSSDNGNTWVQEYQAPFIDMKAVDTRGIGGPAYAVGDKGHIIETTDGGSTWIQKKSPTIYQLEDVCFQALFHAVYAVGWFGQVIKKDEPVDAEFEVLNKRPNHYMMEIEFINADTGWVAAGERLDDEGTKDGGILYTTDGGTNWEFQLHLPAFFNTVDFINGNEGWAGGGTGVLWDEGIIRHTINGGKTWVSQTNPIEGSVDKIFFLDENIGWAVSHDWWGQIAHTTNGGQDWALQTNPTKNPINDVFFINPDKGWAVGMDSTILRTTNGGETWQRVDLTVTNNWLFRSVFFIDEMHGWAVGVYGIIMITNDGGITWQEIRNDYANNLQSVFFIDAQNGWAVGESGTVLRTIDGGYSWFEQYSGIASNYLTSVHFLDKYHGWIGGQGGTIKRTDNGGFWNEPGTYLRNNLNMAIQDMSEISDILTVDFSDEKSSGYQLVGLEVMIDSIVHSKASDLEISLSHQGLAITLIKQVSDPGSDFLWTRLTDEAKKVITDGVAPFCGNHKPFEVLSSFNGLDPSGDWTLTVSDKANGNTGTLHAWGIKPIFEKTVGIHDYPSNASKPIISLLENTPNPFQKTTTIRWISEISGFTSLKLFDVHGKEIKTLLSTDLQKGEHTVELNAEGFTPGIYFYQLQVGDYLLTKKCIIV